MACRLAPPLSCIAANISRGPQSDDKSAGVPMTSAGVADVRRNSDSVSLCGTSWQEGTPMKRHSILVVFVIAALGLTLSFGGTVVAQQKSIKEQLVGTWGYVSSNATRQDGNSLWGEHANGLFILTESGYFSWQVFRSDRP